MKPGLHHRICARPFAICWVLGVLGLGIPVTMMLGSSGAFRFAFADFSTLLLLLVDYTCVVGLGLFIGVMPFFGLVARICRRINGAPYVVGDRVIILTGWRAGTTTTVYELTRGQGGAPVAKVELGAEVRSKHLDLFEDFALLRASGHDAADREARSEPGVGQPPQTPLNALP